MGKEPLVDASREPLRSPPPGPDPLYLTLGLMALALLGWMVWATNSRQEVLALASPQREREVRLEARRQAEQPARTPPSTPTPSPPTTGPNGPVQPDPVLGEGRSATEMAVAPPSGIPAAEDLEQLATRMRQELLELRKSFTAFQTRPGRRLSEAQDRQMRGLEMRVHDLEQRVNSLQSSGATRLHDLEEDLQTTLDRIRADFEGLQTQVG